MRILKIEGKTGACKIAVGDSLSSLGNYCEGGKIGVITDANIRKLHGGKFPKNAKIIEIQSGEGNKTLETVEKIYGELVDAEFDRSSFLVAVGGGMVCDVAGFAASTYMRGIRFGFVPTTLLAQVDASIGGKNGVNFRGYKNMVGVFKQPEFVLCDFELLKTLPPREISCGFAEVIKHACIGDSSLFTFLEENAKQAQELKKTVIEKAVYESLLVKAEIVRKDETEKGERMKLNFGHTLGHAIEKVSGLPHGECVSAGMVLESRISVLKGMLPEKDLGRVRDILEKFNLPLESELPKEKIMDAISKDKKRRGDSVNMALLEGIGKALIVPIKIEEIEAVLGEL